MKTIQEIAQECYNHFQKDYTYYWRFVDKENHPKSRLTLIDYTSDTYLFEFLQLSLDTISKICRSESTPDEMRLSRDWSEPDFPEWDSPTLWKWLISDPSHLEQVQEHVFAAHKLGVEPQLNTCIQCAVWDEWSAVFEAVKLYLVEAYNAQPEDEYENDDCDEDEE